MACNDSMRAVLQSKVVASGAIDMQLPFAWPTICVYSGTTKKICWPNNKLPVLLKLVIIVLPSTKWTVPLITTSHPTPAHALVH